MAVVHAPLAGELVPLDREDQTSAARAFDRPPGTATAPVTRTDSRIPNKKPTPNAPEQRDYSKRMCIAIWHGGGWNAETIEMLDGFAQFDGQQDRSCYLLQTPIHPTPPDVIMAAQRAFSDVRIVETMYGDPATGIITPYALYDFAGAIPQKLAHKARIFFTMPLKVVGPNSLARLEQEAYQANPGRNRENRIAGKAILGVVQEDSKGQKFPFSSFVTVPTWVMEPEFPLLKGLSKWPAKTAAEVPMNHLRYEFLKNMAVTSLINPNPIRMPSDPRFVLLEGRQFGERWPAVEAAPAAAIPAAVPIAPFNPDDFNPPSVSDLVSQQESLEPDLGPQPIRTVSEVPYPKEGLPLPPLAQAVARVYTEGLDWLSAYACPTDLKTLAELHNAEKRRQIALAAPTALDETPEPPKVRRATIKAPVEPLTKKRGRTAKAPLSVPAA